MKKHLLALFGILSLSAVAAQDTPRQTVEKLAARMKAMPAYTVDFSVRSDDYEAAGSYTVENDRYRMRLDGAEVYSDGEVRYEVDPSRREVVIDRVDTTSRNVLENPTRAFDFLDDAFRARSVVRQGTMQEVRLVPTRRGSSVREVVVSVGDDGLPRRIAYRLEEGEVEVRIVKIVASGSVGRFRTEDYPDFEIIDFR